MTGIKTMHPPQILGEFAVELSESNYLIPINTSFDN